MSKQYYQDPLTLFIRKCTSVLPDVKQFREKPLFLMKNHLDICNLNESLKHIIKIWFLVGKAIENKNKIHLKTLSRLLMGHFVI